MLLWIIAIEIQQDVGARFVENAIKTLAELRSCPGSGESVHKILAKDVFELEENVVPVYE